MGHDQRFKEFLHAFLQDFLKLFYPHVEKRLDFESIEFLDKEVFTDRGDGSRREADVVAKLHRRGGRPELVLIHVEVQARPEPDVSRRMFEYYALLRSRYQVPIFPIVVYLRRGRKGLASEELRETLFGREILRFRYESVRLAGLDAEEYLERGGPAAGALAALMNRSARSRTRSLEALRVSMLREVVESALDEARQLLLVDLIETYFPLSDRQKEAYEKLVSREENKKVQDVELTWAEKLEKKGVEKGLEKGLERGLEKGREEGLEEGFRRAKRETLLRLLSAKFGQLPESITRRVERIDSADALDGYLERVLVAETLKDMKLDA